MCDSGEEDEGTNIGLTKLCMQWFSEILPPSLQLLILLGSSQGFNVAPFSLAQTSCFDFSAFSLKPFLYTSRQWGKVSVLCSCNLLWTAPWSFPVVFPHSCMCMTVSVPSFPTLCHPTAWLSRAPVSRWLTAEPLSIIKTPTKPICKVIFLFHQFSNLLSRALALLAGGLRSPWPPAWDRAVRLLLLQQPLVGRVMWLQPGQESSCAITLLAL